VDTNFYTSIFPTVGLRVLAVFENGLQSPPTHSFYDNNDDLMAAAATKDGLGKNVYHGCAVYKTSDSRKGDNVLAIQSIWLDLDVGPKKPYTGQKAAARHYEDFREKLGLPLSHIVVSGGGVHIYQPLSKAIQAKHWDRLAAMYAACLDHFGVKHDTSRTQDKASILRVPDTHNFKTAPPKDVKLRRLGQASSAAALWKLLKAYADAQGLIVGVKPSKRAAPVTNDLIGTKDYPPADGALVAARCPILAEVAATGGDVPYDIWWRAMGVAKHCEDGDTVAAHWTRDRAATHDKSDWQAVTAAWAVGPTTCADFGKHSRHCGSCPHSGGIKSPIKLGVPAQPTIELSAPASSEPLDVMPGEWTFKADWIKTDVGNATFTGYSNGAMTMSVKHKDGTYHYVPFCSRYWQVMERVLTVDNVWKVLIGYEHYPGKPYKTFLLDSAAISAPELLAKEFSARELHFYGNQFAAQKAREIIVYTQSLLFGYRKETAQFPTMGWVSENHSQRGDLTGEFVLGDIVYRPKPEVPQQILLADTVDVTLRADFTSRGTTAQWVELIDRIYNRPNAEAYQFIITAMFASPLVRLMPGGGEWHGIPIVIYGNSGAAKTSTVLAGLSIYAPAQVLRFSAQGGKSGQGDTINALSIKMGSLRNLPWLMDEMSDVEASKFSDIFYMQANGKSKDRMGTNSKMVPNPYRWDAISAITANDSAHEVLKGLRSAKTQEATQLRSFEMTLPNNVRTLFHDIHRSTFEDDLLAQQYGKVGREWIQFLVNNRDRVSEELGKLRKTYMVDPEDTSSIRFYKDLLITIQVAGTLAKSKGFIHWDIAAMIRWGEAQLVKLRDTIGVVDWESTISEFIGSLHKRIIVTRQMRSGAGRRVGDELPLEELSATKIPAARKAIDDKRFVVTKTALDDWAKDKRIMPNTLLAEMLARGYLANVVPGQKATSRMISIGGGSKVDRPRAACYEFDYDMIVNSNGSDEAVDGVADLSNVVQLHPAEVTSAAAVTEEVTVAVTVDPAEPTETSLSP
jgi:Domain of unknown function (DUF927)